MWKVDVTGRYGIQLGAGTQGEATNSLSTALELAAAPLFWSRRYASTEKHGYLRRGRTWLSRPSPLWQATRSRLHRDFLCRMP